MTISRDNPTPLYRQLKALLKDKMADGLLEPNTRLPSERELCEKYGVSRTTVRQALQEMEHEGLVESVPGRGTFVIEPLLSLNTRVSLRGFTSDMKRKGLQAANILLDARLVEQPEGELRASMKLEPGDEVVRLERLRLVNDSPLALHLVYLNHRLCPGILEYNLAQESLFRLLREQYSLTLARAHEDAYATLASAREIDLLDLTPPAAVMRTERVTYLDTLEVIEVAYATYCGDWYRLHVYVETK